ncbi:MAG: TonB-dependent receptor [Gemmatimonadaceae bacterium]
MSCRCQASGLTCPEVRSSSIRRFLKSLLRTAAVVASLAFGTTSSASSQNTTTPRRGEIHGRIVSAAAKAPIASATVEVTIAGATTPVSRVTTTADGAFRVPALALGRYRVMIRALGYRPVEVQAVDIVSAAPRTDVGTIVLTAAALELQAVEVIVHRQDVQLAPDRNTFVVRDMPSTRGGNALDVLRNVPAVDVDIDNVVSLRGNAGVTIQINGRPSPMKPAQLGNFLSQLPADMVDKVEVIPNPSARDDPTGVAGIINIVMKQETDAGTSGGLTLSAGTTGQVNVGGNVGYERGPLTFFGSYGFLRDRRPRTESLMRDNNYLSPITYLDESATRLQKPFAHTLTGSAGYRLREHDDLSLDVTYSTRNQDESYAILYRDLDSARVLTGLSDRTTIGRGNESNFETALGYKHSFAQKGHRLAAEASIVRDQEGGPSSVTARTLTLAGAPSAETALEDQVTWEHPLENVVKVDYVRPLAPLVRLETGYKGSVQEFHTTLDTRVFSSAAGAYLPDTSRINEFTFDETVNAGYAMLSGQRGKFQLQGGLRAEHASSQFHLTTRGATYDKAYNSLFPSALVAFNVDDAHQMKLSYSTRIKRPDEPDLLDPTAHYADPLNLSRGNPNLKPEYIRALELGLQRTGERLTVQLTPFWRRTTDAVRSIRTIDAAGVATRTYANIATSDAYGGDATIAVHGGRLTGFAGASAYHQVSNAANVTPGLSINAFGWRARANATMKFSKTMDVQALVSYQPAMTVEQGRSGSRTQVNFAGRKKLMDDQLSITLRVIDPFDTSRESSTTIDPRFYQVSNRARQVRGLLLGFTWTFGKPEKEKDADLVGGP